MIGRIYRGCYRGQLQWCFAVWHLSLQETERNEAIYLWEEIERNWTERGMLITYWGCLINGYTSVVAIATDASNLIAINIIWRDVLSDAILLTSTIALRTKWRVMWYCELNKIGIDSLSRWRWNWVRINLIQWEIMNGRKGGTERDGFTMLCGVQPS